MKTVAIERERERERERLSESVGPREGLRPAVAARSPSGVSVETHNTGGRTSEL